MFVNVQRCFFLRKVALFKGGIEMRVRFPSPAPISIPTNRIKAMASFNLFKKGQLLTQTANASKFIIPV